MGQESGVSERVGEREWGRETGTRVGESGESERESGVRERK